MNEVFIKGFFHGRYKPNYKYNPFMTTGAIVVGYTSTSYLPNSTTTTEEYNHCKEKYGIELSKSSVKQLMFVAVNTDQIVLELASFQGESFQAYAHLLGCPSGTSDILYSTAKNNYDIIFDNADPSFTYIWLALNDTIKIEPHLSSQCTHLN